MSGAYSSPCSEDADECDCKRPAATIVLKYMSPSSSRYLDRKSVPAGLAKLVGECIFSACLEIPTDGAEKKAITFYGGFYRSVCHRPENVSILDCNTFVPVARAVEKTMRISGIRNYRIGEYIYEKNTRENWLPLPPAYKKLFDSTLRFEMRETK